MLDVILLFQLGRSLGKTWMFAEAAAAATAERIVVGWNDFASRLNPVATLVATTAVLIGPLIFFRGYNSDEGLAVSIARTALEDGKWLVPHVFNLRWVERPTLLSWIIAAISEPFGNVNQFTARLPIALFFFFGRLLIYLLLRRVAATVPAALFGVALFIACPLVIRSSVMTTADLPLAVTLFFAFYLWWDDNEAGTLGTGRWVVIGIVLAIAGLFKGPQPIAYFRARRWAIHCLFAVVAAVSVAHSGRCDLHHIRVPSGREDAMRFPASRSKAV